MRHDYVKYHFNRAFCPGWREKKKEGKKEKCQDSRGEHFESNGRVNSIPVMQMSLEAEEYKKKKKKKKR